MQNFNKDLNLDDLRITQDEFAALDDGHLQLLGDCGYLEHLIKLGEAEIQVNSNNIYQQLYIVNKHFISV